MQNQEKEIVLEVKNLNKVYGDRRVVKNVNLTVSAGEIFGFLGPNGAGKSTTIKMIAGLTSISSGEVLIAGKSIITKFEKAVENIGAMIEVPTLYGYMTGYNNLKYFASLYHGITNRKIMEVARFVGLEGRIYDKVSTYSLGMKQRLGIAQALLHSPKLLILDEPTNGLDANGIKEMRLLLKQLAKEQGIAILISSHILSEMENLCDIIAIINKGEIVEYKTLDEIKREVVKGGSTFIKVNAVNFAGKLIESYTNQKVAIINDKILFDANDQTLAEIIILLTKNKISIFGAGEVDFSLEDVFLNIVSQYNTSTSIS
ncbi:MAG: ABC transporter ATP-binding protein [Christensenellales bacterium]|jgi:ABC-2 type transport system ATP-binding protein